MNWAGVVMWVSFLVFVVIMTVVFWGFEIKVTHVYERENGSNPSAEAD